MINYVPIGFDRHSGEFQHEVELRPGQNELTILATFLGDYHSEVLTVPVTVEGSLEKLMGKGRNVALIIANSDYSKTSYSQLKTPQRDAEDIASQLANRFGFLTALKGRGGMVQNLILYNVGRVRIEEALGFLEEELKPEDSLLIYYAGHGGYQESGVQAYWVPVDATRESQMITASELASRFISNMKARHILVVSDSCFSGAMTRGGDQAVERKGEERIRYIEKKYSKVTRQLMSSGSNEPVADGGGEGHSIFAQAFLDALKDMDEPMFTVSDLYFGHIEKRVLGARGISQAPRLQSIKSTGDESGEFLFRRIPEAHGASIKEVPLDAITDARPHL